MIESTEVKERLFEVRYSVKGVASLKIVKALDTDSAKKQIRKLVGKGVKFITVTPYD